MLASIRNLVDGRMVRSASALYLSQVANYVVPLITVPYLARVLGPDGIGLVFFVQAISLYIMFVIDYAFDSSGTREIARHPNDTKHLAETVAGIMGAKTILALACVAALAAVQVAIPTLRETGWVLWLGVIWYAAIAWRPFWFFLGIERVGTFMAVEVTSKAAAAAGIFLLVNSPEHAWRVLALYAAGSTVTTVVGAVLLYRRVPAQMPTLESSVRWLKRGWNIFVYRTSSNAFSMNNTIILGFLASTATVGFYAGAERINRILLSLMDPVIQAMFPRASGLAKANPSQGAHLARMSTLVVLVAATIGAVILYFLAPLIVRIALGQGFEQSVPVLRILLILLPIVGVYTPLSMHWMIPMGMDRLLTRITVSGVIVHIPLAIVFGSQFGHTGIAWALVITEAFILGTILFMLVYRGLGPFRIGVGTAPGKENAPQATVRGPLQHD